ncbi:MAG: response regulator [Spirochaetales bacterium]|nr:response regulator [Spirochaetales bacterium]
MKDKHYSILVVDDEPSICKSVARYLEDFNFNVTTAADGKSGLQCIAETDFDLMIVDLRLPDMLGEEFITKVHNTNSHVKIFIFTGSLDYVLTEDMIKLGITQEDILYKTLISFEELLEKINNALKQTMEE